MTLTSGAISRPSVTGFVGRLRTVVANTHEEWLTALAQVGEYVELARGGKLPPAAAGDVAVRTTPRL